MSPSEVEGVEVTCYFHGSAESRLRLRGKLPEVDEPARPEVGRLVLTRLRRGGVAEGQSYGSTPFWPRAAPTV
jgi:hypothetical protein